MVNGWADADRGLFSISVAAELAGLHPQTLRIYEREGLLDPARSTGGTRRYSTRDIGRLQEICALTADGLNLAGIRRVLALLEETRRLEQELAALRALAAGSATAEPGAPEENGDASEEPRPAYRAHAWQRQDDQDPTLLAMQQRPGGCSGRRASSASRASAGTPRRPSRSTRPFTAPSGTVSRTRRLRPPSFTWTTR